MNRAMRITAVAVAAGVVAACAADDPHRRAKTGAAIGAVAGAVIGKQVGDDRGALVGAAVGALGGAAVGHYMDRQQQEMEARLEEERRQHELEIERLRNDTLKINVQSEVMFDFDSAALKPAFRSSLDKMADIIRKYEKTAVHVVGHTDSVGSEAYNQSLSERRAGNTADYLISRGVTRERLVAYGRGEDQPRATNETASGRQLNRRVEIYVKPIVEGREQEAFQPPV